MSKEATTRDTVARIMADASASGGAAEEAEEPASGAQAAVDESEAAPEPARAQEEPTEPPVAKPERPRAPDGKFAAAEKAKAAAEAQPAKVAEKPPAEPAAAKLKAPADWRPAAQVEFDKLPRVVQEEAIRLHVETKKTLQEAAQHRQAAETWQRTVAPYEHMFRAAGKSPAEGVGWLVQQYAALQTAPMAQRAGIVAGLVRDFIGVDEASINLLASALEGRPAPAGAGAPTAIRPEQIQQLIENGITQREQLAARTAEIKAIQDFEASAPEYLPNLTNEIATIVTMAKKQGKPITIELLKDAHARALRMNPETAAILKQRDDAAAAGASNAAAAKAAAAASGLRNEPGGPVAPEAPKNTRDQVRLQLQRQAGRARV